MLVKVLKAFIEEFMPDHEITVVSGRGPLWFYGMLVHELTRVTKALAFHVALEPGANTPTTFLPHARQRFLEAFETAHCMQRQARPRLLVAVVLLRGRGESPAISPAQTLVPTRKGTPQPHVLPHARPPPLVSSHFCNTPKGVAKKVAKNRASPQRATLSAS